MRYGLVVLFAVVLVLFVGVGGVFGAVDCPPGSETFIACPKGVPPTEKMPPTDGGNPTATPKTPPPGPEGSPTVGVTPSPGPEGSPYPGPGEPPEVTAYPGPGKPGNPPSIGRGDPQPVETLPVTGGGGTFGDWQLTVVGMTVFLGVAFLARMVRRATG